ncbi:MAG: aminoglycoside phosphotransferase family protein [Chloroflexi bacterium]|nr:aminoglycoside phosphotransferase family protein [Chloroflexota bacterium]
MTQSAARKAQLLAALQAEVQTHYPEWQADHFEIAGQGLEGLVCRADTDAFGPVAIKTPWQRFVSDDFGIWDLRAYLEQEAVLTLHACRHGVPSPAIRALHLNDDGLDFLASEFIARDDSPLSFHDLGRLVRSIHDCPPVERTLVAERPGGFNAMVAARVADRARAVERYAELILDRLRPELLNEILGTYVPRRQLLHMDARPANLFTRQSRVVAINDWGNALHGDPVFELARVAEAGNLRDGFLAGYGDAAIFDSVPPAVETIYRLDTAMMLVIVFLFGEPDVDRARRQVVRTQALYDQLCAFV